MNTEIRDLSPEVIRRHCGGFLAVSRRESGPQIAVTADSEDEALRKWFATMEIWRVNLEQASH